MPLVPPRHLLARALCRITHPGRQPLAAMWDADGVDRFIDSRALEYATQLEDKFVDRAMKLGVTGGMILDLGTHTGLIALKLCYFNGNFYALGVDESRPMIERARETAAAWGLGGRAFFQVGDIREMRFKAGYFDLVVSDGALHRLSDPVDVLVEIRRVLKPRGALLIRDFRRPNRFRMSREMAETGGRFGAAMRPQVEQSLKAAFTPIELIEALRNSGLERAQVVDLEDGFLGIERRGSTDPNSWIAAREQYL